ncbi:UNVERIFIED_CONTAM: hypothetical protein PYX00_007476 [Menopon gallinae]|uniref:AN1-type domain-containing protein n=1 Tax=Menopon gallinae TaxID=328185 RepID=A0AAW2HIY6_9NEOP
MEFPDLGKNCAWPPCKELDFLPLTCVHCNSVFCKNHINTDKHECPKAGCENTDHAPIQTFICMYDECKSSSAVEMICPKCKNHFCLEHRYHNCFNPSETDIQAKKLIWDAAKQQYTQSINEVNKIVNEGLKKSMQNPKKQEAAQKINLMRLKTKAQGPNNVPTASRVYFSIIIMKDADNQLCKSIFTNKDWSVGRVIDSISELCNVVNKNNVANAKKLRLFRRKDGVQISTDMSVKVDDLISSNQIINGDCLIMEYVNPDEDLTSFKLTNFDDYREM